MGQLDEYEYMGDSVLQGSFHIGVASAMFQQQVCL